MSEPDRKPNAEPPWLEIHDEIVTSEALVQEIETRVARRRAELGPVKLIFSTFGHISTFPDPAPNDKLNPHLYYYLKRVNETPPPTVAPVLAPSPATRMPVVGRFWRQIRGEVHNLVLFYVNRSVQEQNRLNIDLISTMNELTRVVQEQQAELEALRAEVRRLRE